MLFHEHRAVEDLAVENKDGEMRSHFAVLGAAR